MVVVNMEASVCGEAGPAGTLPGGSPASNGHRAWYEQNPSSAGSPLASSNPATSFVPVTIEWTAASVQSWTRSACDSVCCC